MNGVSKARCLVDGSHLSANVNLCVITILCLVIFTKALASYVLFAKYLGYVEEDFVSRRPHRVGLPKHRTMQNVLVCRKSRDSFVIENAANSVGSTTVESRHFC